MKSCITIHNIKDLNKTNKVNSDIKEIKEIIKDFKNVIDKLEAAVEKLENKEKKVIEPTKIKKNFSVEDIKNMSNEEIQELFNNHICYVEYRKRNGEYRIFENFTFKPEYRTKVSEKSVFDYKKELKKFVFGIEIKFDKDEYKRLLPQNIIHIEIIY